VSAERKTVYRWSLVWSGTLVAAVGAVLLGWAVHRAGAWGELGGTLGVALMGWGSLVQALQSLALTPLVAGIKLTPEVVQPLVAGTVVWLVGWALVAGGIRRAPESSGSPSAASGAPLYPRLARYRDFYWSTLAAYGGGILLSELTLIFAQTLLASGDASGRSEATRGALQLAPAAAFVVSITLASLVAFIAGFIGASRAQRMAFPEATIGVLYLGLPVPVLLTLMQSVPALQIRFGYRLREINYLADLLGRPEMGIWLVFLLLVLMLLLGINTGFIAAGSGRLDLRSGFELFVARRHVGVFRPSLLLGTLAVLMFGIIPPILIYGILRAVEFAVERTRIRSLGLADPLQATAALEDFKLRTVSPTTMMTALSVGGVGTGVMALIIVLSVMSGFEEDMQKKIVGTQAHVVVDRSAGDIVDWNEVVAKVEKVPGVTGAAPHIDNPAMIVADGAVEGIMVHGIDPTRVGSVLDLPRNMLPGGTLEHLEHPEKVSPRRSLGLLGSQGGEDTPPAEGEEVDPIIGRMTKPPEQALPAIILGQELAAKLRVVAGDRINLISPKGADLGPTGFVPKSKAFRVSGLFFSGMYEFDSSLAYIHLREAQQLFDFNGAESIELKVADLDDARRIASNVSRELGGYPFRARDWGQVNRNLFSALRLEKLVMGIILSIIIVVAAGLIVATVIMLVLEKRKEISVLKALGVPDSGVLKIFLAEGLQIGVAGGLLGLFAGLGWCLFIEKVGIKLDPSVYYISSLPVKIEPLQTALAFIIAVFVTYLASIYPALKASSVEPVEGLKAE
jgi:lipoprotein-releasing system permease protein